MPGGLIQPSLISYSSGQDPNLTSDINTSFSNHMLSLVWNLQDYYMCFSKVTKTNLSFIAAKISKDYTDYDLDNASRIIALNFKIYQNNKKNKARKEKWKELIQEVKLYPQDVSDENHPIIGREYREYFNNSTWKQIHNLSSK